MFTQPVMGAIKIYGKYITGWVHSHSTSYFGNKWFCWSCSGRANKLTGSIDCAIVFQKILQSFLFAAF